MWIQILLCFSLEKKYYGLKRLCRTSPTWEPEARKSPKCRLTEKLSLAPLWPRITLKHTEYALRVNVFNERECPRGRPQGQYMRQHGKIWKNRSKKSFRTMFSDDFFRFFPEAPGAFPREDLKIFEGFLMSWSSGKLPGMILDESGELHFFMKILKKVVFKLTS